MEIKIMNESEIPMFNKGDIVKDKFSNLFEVYDMVFSERFNRNAPGYDKMGYRLKLIGNHTSSPVRMVGNVAGFYNTGEVLWIYNTEEDAELDKIKVTEDHLFATELSLDELDVSSDSVNSAKAEDVPRFAIGDLVRDKFSNLFKIIDTTPFKEGDDDNMHFHIELANKHPNSPERMASMYAKFNVPGVSYWVYDTEEAAIADEVAVNGHYLYATELVLVQSALQMKSAKPAKADIVKRYPSIEDLQKISEENDLGNLLDRAYKILKEQASLGERHSNLEAETFKRCIPHFEREGFDITEHGTLIEVRW